LEKSQGSFPMHFCKPVPPFGVEQAGLLVVGLAPGLHGANRTARPFTGDYCGPLLYGTLHRHGFAALPSSDYVGDGQQLINCRVTNAVKCVPPENKPLPTEIRQCNRYLQNEIEQFTPKAILALGVVAHQAVLMATGQKQSAFKFVHGARYDIDGLTLFDSYHVSRYNTQTRRLTESMFDNVIATIRTFLNAP
jgi:uracil-DNA glycosylase family 4